MYPYNIRINVCIMKIQIPRAREVKNQCVIAKRTSQRNTENI